MAAEIKQGKKVPPKQAVVDEARSGAKWAMHFLMSCMTSLLCLISPSLSSAVVTASPARRGRKAKAADLEVTALAKEAKQEHEEQENEEKKKVGLKVPALPNDY